MTAALIALALWVIASTLVVGGYALLRQVAFRGVWRVELLVGTATYRDGEQEHVLVEMTTWQDGAVSFEGAEVPLLFPPGTRLEIEFDGGAP